MEGSRTIGARRWYRQWDILLLPLLVLVLVASLGTWGYRYQERTLEERARSYLHLQLYYQNLLTYIWIGRLEDRAAAALSLPGLQAARGRAWQWDGLSPAEAQASRLALESWVKERGYLGAGFMDDSGRWIAGSTVGQPGPPVPAETIRKAWDKERPAIWLDPTAQTRPRLLVGANLSPHSTVPGAPVYFVVAMNPWKTLYWITAMNLRSYKTERTLLLVPVGEKAMIMNVSPKEGPQPVDPSQAGPGQALWENALSSTTRTGEAMNAKGERVLFGTQYNGLFGWHLLATIQRREVLSTMPLTAFLVWGSALLSTLLMAAWRYLAWTRRQQALVDALASRLQEMVRRLLTAQEEERRTIARELHDDLSQLLAAAEMFVVGAENAWGRGEPDPARRALRQGRQSLSEAARKCRHIITLLRPPELVEQGLVGALRHQLDSAVPSGARFLVSGEDLLAALPQEVSLAVFRIAQEAVQNALKHGGGREIEVRLEADGEGLTLSVEDGGRGFDPDERIAPGHFGLEGMRERALLIGASLDIRSRPGGGGTRVVLTWSRSSGHGS